MDTEIALNKIDELISQCMAMPDELDWVSPLGPAEISAEWLDEQQDVRVPDVEELMEWLLEKGHVRLLVSR